jgi:hypothetical protein
MAGYWHVFCFAFKENVDHKKCNMNMTGDCFFHEAENEDDFKGVARSDFGGGS